MELYSKSKSAENSLYSAGFQRHSNNLRKKFYQFLLPSVLSYAAGCLTQFLDSIVVAQILGSRAMSMVNMANPLILIINTVYVLIGIGGSTIYATLKGKMEKRQASVVFTISAITAGLVSTVILIAGLLLLHPMVQLFSSGLDVPAEFTDYVLIILFTAPFIILVATILMFFPVEGAILLAGIIQVTANISDILFDILYMKVFHMGLAGAAYATMTSYALAAVLIICFVILKICPLGFCRIALNDFKELKGIIAKGAASSVSQIGYCIKVSFSNYIAAYFAGSVGVIVFSACYQTIMIVSIFIGGIINAMNPIVAVLFGQRDYKGIRLLLKNILIMELAITALLVLSFELCPSLILRAYGLTAGKELALGSSALRIFSIMYLFRHTMLIFMNCFQITGRKFYAVAVSIIDGFIGIIPIALVMCFAFHMEITGLWLAYPVYSALLLLGILIKNLIILNRSKGTLQGIYLLPDGKTESALLDISLPGNIDELVKFTEDFNNFCIGQGIAPSKANIATVACEEICVFVYSKRYDNPPEIDILIRVIDDDIFMNFRSIGQAFDPLHIPSEGQYSNIEVLTKLAKEIRYDYVLGMNQTQIII